MMSAQHIDEAIPVDRFGHVIRCAQSEAHFFVIEHGQDNDGDVRRVGIGLQRRQHRPAIRFRHEHIQCDQVRLQFLGQLDPFLAAWRNGDTEPFFGQKPAH